MFQERGRGSGGSTGVHGEEVQRFEDLLLQQREAFAEEEIRHSFPKLLAFVLQVKEKQTHVILIWPAFDLITPD